MPGERFPRGVPLCPDDFRKCGWREVLASAAREGYPAMWRALSAAARRAIEEGRHADGKALWLLADACSMMLRPTSPNEPFKPFAVFDGKRSALPEDFQPDDVELFAQVVEEIEDPWLRARLADLLWLAKRPRDPKFALIAIDAYRQLPLDRETWVHGGHECWERAISLAILLRAGAGIRLQEMESAVNAAFESATPEDRFLALWLSDLLAEFGLARSRAKDIATKLEALAKRFDADGDLHPAREYFIAASRWHEKAGDRDKVAEMTVSLAEAWVKEAAARMSSSTPSHLVAATFLQNAIHAYRRIPRKQRPGLKVDERIAELHRMMADAGARAIDEMTAIASPKIDITELVENARNAVRGKELLDALGAFADLYPGVRNAKLRENAIESLRNHPLQALFPAVVVSRDGRTIAKRPGMSTSATGFPEDEAVIWAEMVKHYAIELGIAVQGEIWPALETLLLEHRFREQDLVAISARSPVVPHGREGFWGKGLFAGFDQDFVSATHLLVPQVEHMVRWHLKARGVKTTTLDERGIETEVGLSALLDLPEAKDVFGEDLVFELRALFADPAGPNLRNEVAHGLLEYEAAQSAYAIYAWWLGFKLVFKTFHRQQAAEKGKRANQKTETNGMNNDEGGGDG